MDKRREDAHLDFRVVLANLCILTFLALPMSVSADPKLIAIEECQLNGFPLGGTIEEMRSALGEPDSVLPVLNTGDEYPHLEASYDGLRIVFSTRGQTALSYFVTSEKYLIRSGVGVGSTRQEIEGVLGPTSYYKSGDTVFMVYRLAGPGGRALPVQFDIRLQGDVAVGLSLVSR
ncbi:MAG: hypothetical protein OEW64_12330 [Gammaproteobacteria bacterium]|nr:hypothetical protein [Gammaproteobacteria bacterium]MDH5304867.1 hypothetical protein [Gammaproteobacteria bacterium]